MHRAQDVAKTDPGRRPGEHITAVLATQAAHQLGGLEFKQNLDKVTGRKPLLLGEFLDPPHAARRKCTGEPEYGTRGIIALNRELHPDRLGCLHGPAQIQKAEGVAPFIPTEGKGPWEMSIDPWNTDTYGFATMSLRNRCRRFLHPWALSLALALLIGASGGCRRPDATPAAATSSRAVPVVLAAAHEETVAETISLIGSVTANESVDLKTETDGVVQEILFQEGQDVERGQLLLRLDDTKLAAALAEAEANFKLSETTFVRSRQLLQDKLISQQEFDQAAGTDERFHASVDFMKRQLRDARIVAPFSGTVGARNVSPGQVISRATVLTSLVDLNPVKVEFYVPERFLSQVQNGQTVAITVAAHPGRTFQGVVYFIAPQLDPETRKVLVKARIANEKRDLKPGMFANLDLSLTLRDRAIVIPEIALMFDGDKARVFVVDSNQVATFRAVQVGLRLPGRTEILSGLQAGETLIVEVLQKVYPGAGVTAAAGTGPAAPAAGATNAPTH